MSKDKKVESIGKGKRAPGEPPEPTGAVASTGPQAETENRKPPRKRANIPPAPPAAKQDKKPQYSPILTAQFEFMKAVPRLIDHAHQLGFQVSGGDLYRDPRAEYGSLSSRHKMRLAIDLNLFRDGKYLTDGNDHLPLAEFWESMGGIAGLRFADGNHYEWPIPG